MRILAKSDAGTFVRRALAAAALLAAPAVLAAQGERPVDPATAIAAAQTCREAPLGFDEAQRYIAGQGWRPTNGGLTREQRAMILPFPMFVRDHVMLVLLPLDNGRRGSCGINAMVRRGTAWRDLLPAVNAAFGREPVASGAGEAHWLFDDRTARANLAEDAFIIRFRPIETPADTPTAAPNP